MSSIYTYIDDAQCNRCSQLSEWNGKPLPFVIDHINDNVKDERPENVRLLCPNCYDQVKTQRRKQKRSQGK